MLMDVLERSYETDVYHERDPRAFNDYLMRDKSVIDSLMNESPAPRFVIKALCESQKLRKLLDDYEPAKAIWVMRDYHDVVNSMLVSFSGQAEQVKRIANDRDSEGWRGSGMTDETHELVNELVSDDITDASAAALLWYFRNKLFFDQNLNSDPRVQIVQYESLVVSPHKTFKRLLDFVDISYSERLSSKVFSSSISRRPPPKIDTKITELCDGMLNSLVNLIDDPYISENS